LTAIRIRIPSRCQMFDRAPAPWLLALGLIVSTSTSDPITRPASYGYYLHDAAAVWVRPDRDRADMAATLAHELTHAVTHDACAGMTRDVSEVVAESVAYAVCSRFGLDLSLRSVDYVAGWGHPQGHDPDAFRVGMAAIHDGAASLIDAIEAAMTDAGEFDRAARRRCPPSPYEQSTVAHVGTTLRRQVRQVPGSSRLL
jgi:hypothetical protein